MAGHSRFSCVGVSRNILLVSLACFGALGCQNGALRAFFGQKLTAAARGHVDNSGAFCGLSEKTVCVGWCVEAGTGAAAANSDLHNERRITATSSNTDRAGVGFPHYLRSRLVRKRSAS